MIFGRHLAREMDLSGVGSVIDIGDPGTILVGLTDTQAVATIVRITGGNFRLVLRLFVQIERILRINGLKAIADEVVEAARSILVIGAT
ncbi:hypothetical protein [Aquamicrobium sp. LC103]|uniref:hypothetical protein n=1 Tax=Aquamicrobium sp. LC103 TaxID=1120658 RepID=UPI00063E75D7